MPPFVKVTWHDAEDIEGPWVKSEEIASQTKEPCEVISWGYLVSRTRKDYILAGDYIPRDNTYGRVTKIPRKMTVKLDIVEGQHEPGSLQRTGGKGKGATDTPDGRQA